MSGGSGSPYLVRTGRGGAGNFASPKRAQDVAAKEKAEDLEAQRPAARGMDPDDNGTAPGSTAATGEYARSGRGGAGNFLPASTSLLPSSSSSSSSDLPTRPPSGSAPPAAPRPQHVGRGGAGNWAAAADGAAAAATGEGEGARRARDEQDRRRREALDAGIAREIRASIPQPPRTYQLHGRRPEGPEEQDDDNSNNGNSINNIALSHRK
ncbi:hypothetical protein SAMD00023353_2800820 [Rosellinia necatrix]|uniref:Uncharacterized protein n=1 Tax=Rosellinia necatrix TaxID=77044 RepID=A0A1W2THX3_ROSNE|nr:hypothetical protein SAMD00023353_2800820 [Rosellinia necatrix]